jgi:hypothetical protein
MQLIDIINQLRNGELANTSLSEKLDYEEYPKIVSYVNLALTALHSRFNIKQSEVVIQEYSTINIYTFDSKYAVSNTGSAEPIKYIIDTIDTPFTNDLIRIETIEDSNGDILLLNDQTESTSIKLPSYNKIKVVAPIDEELLIITYKANHDKVLVSGLTTTDQEIYIPEVLLEPLLYHIASRFHSSLPNAAGISESEKYISKYENACIRIKLENLINEYNYSTDRMGDRGWV